MGDKDDKLYMLTQLLKNDPTFMQSYGGHNTMGQIKKIYEELAYAAEVERERLSREASDTQRRYKLTRKLDVEYPPVFMTLSEAVKFLNDLGWRVQKPWKDELSADQLEELEQWILLANEDSTTP